MSQDPGIQGILGQDPPGGRSAARPTTSRREAVAQRGLPRAAGEGGRSTARPTTSRRGGCSAARPTTSRRGGRSAARPTFFRRSLSLLCVSPLGGACEEAYHEPPGGCSAARPTTSRRGGCSTARPTTSRREAVAQRGLPRAASSGSGTTGSACRRQRCTQPCSAHNRAENTTRCRRRPGLGV